MAHDFIKQEGASVCENCGYVWGEKPYQKCPMSLTERNKKTTTKSKNRLW